MISSRKSKCNRSQRKQVAMKEVAFTEAEIETRANKTGGFFWNKHHESIADVEESAFGRLRAFAFIEKFKHSKDYSNIKRVQVLKQQFGNTQPRFTKYIFSSREKSVVERVFFHNIQHESQSVYRPKPIKTTYFSDLQSTTLQLEPPIDFSEFLMVKSKTDTAVESVKSTDEENNILNHPLLKEVISRTPFFTDIESFRTTSDKIETMTYKQRAYVYYVFAEFYLQAFYKASALYNVELMTYYTSLFEKFETQTTSTADSKGKDRMKKQIKRFNSIKDCLKRGDIGTDLTFGMRDSFGNAMAMSSETLVDPSTGLPLESPLLHYGRGWPFTKSVQKPKEQDYSKIKVKTIAQMAELLLNEPVVHDVDAIDKSKKMKQLYLIKSFEPIVTSDLSTINVKDKSMLYLEDLRSKMLIAIRELRKNLILNSYHEGVSPGRSQSSEVIEKLQKEFTDREKSADPERRQSKLEFTLDEVFDKVLRPVTDKLTALVSDNIITASKKVLLHKSGNSSFGELWFDADSDAYNNNSSVAASSFQSNNLLRPSLMQGRPVGHRVKF